MTLGLSFKDDGNKEIEKNGHHDVTRPPLPVDTCRGTRGFRIKLCSMGGATGGEAADNQSAISVVMSLSVMMCISVCFTRPCGSVESLM